MSIGDERYDINFKRVYRMVKEFNYFAHCLLTGSSPTLDFEHGLVNMQIMESIYEAAEQDRVIKISADR